MKISVVIPCRNEKKDITEVLDSIFEQELDPEWEFEVLVADGMSDDGTRDALRPYAARQPDMHLIDNPGRIVSTGLNAGIAGASGDVILRMDAHTIYAQDYIRECVAVLEETGADAAGGAWVAKGRGRIGTAIAAAFQSRFCAGGNPSRDANYEGEVDLVYLGCFRRSVFEKAGMFDPDLVRNQDDEFSFRMRRCGLRIWQSRRIRSSYTPRDSIRALFRQYVQYGFWRVAVIRKHRLVAAWRHLVPLAFVLSIFGLLGLMGISAITPVSAIGMWAGAALAIELAVYFVACVAASLPFARTLDPPALAMLPMVMAVYHVAYGLGFLAGMVKPAKSGRAGRLDRLFTSLTR